MPPRFFNIAGPCRPDLHYMLPPERRLPSVRTLIEQQAYFTVRAPRQSGKTTSFLALAESLTAEGRYAALLASCETGQTARGDVEAGVMAIIRSIEAAARLFLPEDLRPSVVDSSEVEPPSRLAFFLSSWARACLRPLVLFLDEIDALMDDSLISVLRQLRSSYPGRPSFFPQSIALIGLRDVRDYELLSQVRPVGATLGTASPFNIKAESLTLRDFTADEVAELCGQHTAETGQRFSGDALAEIYHQTRGQPWLVNALAAQLTTRFDALIAAREREVERDHVLQVREILIERRDTHLDSLAHRLRELRVQRVIETILTGDAVFDPSFDDDFSFVRDLGLVRLEKGRATISNPIYQEIIPRILSFHVQAAIPDEPEWFVAPDGTLDIPKLIEEFLVFWRRHGEVLLRGMPYHEAAPHLVFMAYLQRIINSGGRIQREFAIGTGRADIVVDFGGREDIIELKLLRGSHTLPEGLDQVARYANRLGRDRGYLILFDPAASIPWEQRGQIEELEHRGARVVLVKG